MKQKVVENLNELENLEQLWLGKNKINALQGLDNLKKLKILSIQVIFFPSLTTGTS
jgi:protein phosphatase 1 regulatory subunit 7